MTMWQAFWAIALIPCAFAFHPSKSEPKPQPLRSEFATNVKIQPGNDAFRARPSDSKNVFVSYFLHSNTAKSKDDVKDHFRGYISEQHEKKPYNTIKVDSPIPNLMSGRLSDLPVIRLDNRHYVGKNYTENVDTVDNVANEQQQPLDFFPESPPILSDTIVEKPAKEHSKQVGQKQQTHSTENYLPSVFQVSTADYGHVDPAQESNQQEIYQSDSASQQTQEDNTSSQKYYKGTNTNLSHSHIPEHPSAGLSASIVENAEHTTLQPFVEQVSQVQQEAQPTYETQSAHEINHHIGTGIIEQPIGGYSGQSVTETIPSAPSSLEFNKLPVVRPSPPAPPPSDYAQAYAVKHKPILPKLPYRVIMNSARKSQAVQAQQPQKHQSHIATSPDLPAGLSPLIFAEPAVDIHQHHRHQYQSKQLNEDAKLLNMFWPMHFANNYVQMAGVLRPLYADLYAALQTAATAPSPPAKHYASSIYSAEQQSQQQKEPQSELPPHLAALFGPVHHEYFVHDPALVGQQQQQQPQMEQFTYEFVARHNDTPPADVPPATVGPSDDALLNDPLAYNFATAFPRFFAVQDSAKHTTTTAEETEADLEKSQYNYNGYGFVQPPSRPTKASEARHLSQLHEANFNPDMVTYNFATPMPRFRPSPTAAAASNKENDDYGLVQSAAVFVTSATPPPPPPPTASRRPATISDDGSLTFVVSPSIHNLKEKPKTIATTTRPTTVVTTARTTLLREKPRIKPIVRSTTKPATFAVAVTTTSSTTAYQYTGTVAPITSTSKFDSEDKPYLTDKDLVEFEEEDLDHLQPIKATNCVDGERFEAGACRRHYYECVEGEKVTRFCARLHDVFSTREGALCVAKRHVAECAAAMRPPPARHFTSLTTANGSTVNLPPSTTPKPNRVVGKNLMRDAYESSTTTPFSFCADRMDGFYRHPDNCSRIYQCFGGEEFEYPPCANNLVFDERTGVCNYRDQVEGCSTKSPPATHDGKSSSLRITDATRNTGRPSTLRSESDAEAADPSDADDSAIFGFSSSAGMCNKHGEHIANEENCSTFYRCVLDRPVLMTCPFGTVFNPRLNVCDYPHNVPSCSSKTGRVHNAPSEEK